MVVQARFTLLNHFFIRRFGAQRTLRTTTKIGKAYHVPLNKTGGRNHPLINQKLLYWNFAIDVTIICKWFRTWEIFKKQ